MDSTPTAVMISAYSPTGPEASLRWGKKSPKEQPSEGVDPADAKNADSKTMSRINADVKDVRRDLNKLFT